MPIVEAAGIRLHVQRLGGGEPVVVLVHGLAPYGNMAYWYVAVGPQFSKACSLVLYDLRGFGLSDQPPTGYTMDDMVADLAGLLDALGLGDRPVVLAGHSFGATIALHFTLQHPDRVSAVALMEPYLGAGDVMGLVVKTRDVLEQDGIEARQRRAMELFEEWLAEDVDQDATVTRRQVERLGSRRRSAARDKAISLVFGTSLVDDVATLPVVADDQLATIACPTLLVYGDESFLREEGERLAGLIPRSRLEILAGTGHMMIQTAPQAVTDRLVAWLEHLRADPRPVPLPGGVADVVDQKAVEPGPSDLS